MTLRRIEVSDFRCLESASCVLDRDFTFISGPNASGKTSLLESIYLLGRGRSFRSRRLDNLIRRGSARFLIVGEAEVRDQGLRLGIEGSHEGMRAKVGGQRVRSLAELAAALPVQIIDPEVHHLIEEGPSRRRRFLDWGVFHVEHGFVDHWQRYQQALKQRNAALRAHSPRSLVTAWDPELLALGRFIHEARARYVGQLAPAAQTIAQNLLGLPLELTYHPGWPRDQSFEEALAGGVSHDEERGTTHAGPHRAELVIRLDGTPVKDRISRGQQKLVAASLLLAQLRCFPEEASVRPTLLLDDPSAELDNVRLLALIREVSRHSLQLIVTSLNDAFSAFGSPGRRYRIAAGKLQET